MQSEIPDDVVEAARVLNMKLHSATELGQRTQWIAEALLAERKAALSAAEPIGFLIPRGDVAGPDNEYYSFCEDQGSAAAEADIYDKGYFPIYSAPPALTAQVQDVAGWQDISTAPKDGTMIIAYGLGVISLSRWVENFAPVYHWDGGPAFYSYVLDRPHSPTHWMHLPSPPTSQEG